MLFSYFAYTVSDGCPIKTPFPGRTSAAENNSAVGERRATLYGTRFKSSTRTRHQADMRTWWLKKGSWLISKLSCKI